MEISPQNTPPLTPPDGDWSEFAFEAASALRNTQDQTRLASLISVVSRYADQDPSIAQDAIDSMIQVAISEKTTDENRIEALKFLANHANITFFIFLFDPAINESARDKIISIAVQTALEQEQKPALKDNGIKSLFLSFSQIDIESSNDTAPDNLKIIKETSLRILRQIELSSSASS